MSIRKLAMGLLFAACGLAHGADTSTDVLIWYVDLDDSEESALSESTFDGINISAVSSDGARTALKPKTYATLEDLALSQNPVTGTTGRDFINEGVMASGRRAGWYYTDLSGYDSSYSFAVELWADNIVAWMTKPASWDTIAAMGGLYNLGTLSENDFTPLDSVKAYNFGPHVVPEPSSGLLLLLGGCLLALQRRRHRV